MLAAAAHLARIAAALSVPVTAFYGAATACESDRGFTYLRSAGAVRLARAYAGIAERGSRANLVTLAEALARGGRA